MVVNGLISYLGLYYNLTHFNQGPLNNIAAAVIQRLSTVALLQQISNNNINNPTANVNLKSQTEDQAFEITNQKIDNSDTSISEENSQKCDAKQKSGLGICGLDLSLKTKKPAKTNNDSDTAEDFFNALSPVSTSSTNLSTSSLSSISKLMTNEKSMKNGESKCETPNNKKGILDVINRLKSQKSTNGQSGDSQAEQKSSCSEHELNSGGLDELNDLIKSHLLPISEAVFDKYKTFFENKKSEDDDEEHNDNFETPMVNSEHEEALKSGTGKIQHQCTFCNIFKNLIDLHELLHKT